MLFVVYVNNLSQKFSRQMATDLFAHELAMHMLVQHVYGVLTLETLSSNLANLLRNGA